MITVNDPAAPTETVVLHRVCHTATQHFFQDSGGTIWSASDADGANLSPRRWPSRDAFDQHVRLEKRNSSMFDDLVWAD